MDYSGFNATSTAALAREKQAIEAFEVHKSATMNSLVLSSSPPRSAKNVTQLLTPEEHLTGPWWKQFASHVRQYPGWNVKKRQLTSTEKLARSRPRRGVVSFVDAIFTPPKAVKPKADAKRGNDEAPKEGSVKKAKKSTGEE